VENGAMVNPMGWFEFRGGIDRRSYYVKIPGNDVKIPGNEEE
jgi:hypothetical protein